MVPPIYVAAHLVLPPSIAQSNFFQGSPAKNWDVGRANLKPHHVKINTEVGAQLGQTNLLTISPIEEILSQLPSPLTTFTLLHLDLSLIGTHRLASVGGRLLLFVHNWEILTRDPLVLATVKGYHLSLYQWPSQRLGPVNFTLDSKKQEALTEEIHNLEAKGAVVPVKAHQVHLTSSLFVVPISGGG